MLIEKMKTTFAERCKKNPSYSLRAFSRSLGMDSSTISAIMNGKRPLTIKSAKKIIAGLEIDDPLQAQTIIAETFAEKAHEEALTYKELNLEASEATAYWENFAILAVLELKDFKGTERNIADRLNIPIGIVWDCLDRLTKLGLTKKTHRGWELTGKNLSTPADIPSGVIRSGHRQCIEKAIASLENDPIDARDISGITMAVSKTKLKQAKKLIQDFRRKLSVYMEEGPRDAVYRLNVQFFPLTQENK